MHKLSTSLELFKFEKLERSLIDADESLNNGNLRILEQHSTNAFQALKDIETKVQFIRVKAYLQHGFFAHARAIAQSIKETPNSLGYATQLIHILMEEKKNMWTCSATSRQHVILNHQTRQRCGSLSSQFFKSSFRILSDGVKSLKIYNFRHIRSYGEWVKNIKEIPDMLTSVSLNSLEVLTIVANSCFPNNQIRRLLQNSRLSLEEVNLHGVIITINEVLDICLNLKRLELQQFHYTSYDAPQRLLQSPSQYPSLTYLYIQDRSYLEASDFKETLKRLTNLQKINFDLLSCSDSQLRQLHQYGSKQLRHICIGGPPNTATHIGAINGNSFIDTSHYRYTIDVNESRDVTATVLLQLVNCSVNMKQMIEAISFCPQPRDQLDAWSSFQYFTAPCLQYMRFSFNNETEKIFANVIRNCPTLQVVSIFRFWASPSNITIDALKTLSILRSFSFGNPSEIDHETDERPYAWDVNDTVIREFFTYHVLLNKHSTLQEVSLRNISNLEPETFKILFKIKNLKSLNLEGSLLPNHLKSLVLEGLRGITDYDVQFLDFPTIKLLKLDDLTTTGLTRMVKNSKKLKKLRVDLCDNKSLQYRIPVEIVDCMKRNNVQFNWIL
ncbi:hypothetical protein BDC45DRAFT_610544 [Circinella umbellata]|nr:hypothetical protein BDC45DRAFT_610544 [Circinella umbellata]